MNAAHAFMWMDILFSWRWQMPPFFTGACLYSMHLVITTNWWFWGGVNLEPCFSSVCFSKINPDSMGGFEDHMVLIKVGLTSTVNLIVEIQRSLFSQAKLIFFQRKQMFHEICMKENILEIFLVGKSNIHIYIYTYSLYMSYASTQSLERSSTSSISHPCQKKMIVIFIATFLPFWKFFFTMRTSLLTRNSTRRARRVTEKHRLPLILRTKKYGIS